jgi:hypothetical protein
MLRVRNLLLAVGLGSAFALTSCGKEEAAGLPLAYAPADALYVLGNREPIPDAVMDAWWSRTEPLMAGYAPILETTLANMPESARSKHPLAAALLGELSKLRSRADFTALGLGGSTNVALYGVGIIPVMRLQLDDPTALKAMVARAEAKAGVKAEMLTLGSYEYYRIDATKVEVVIAVGQRQLVTTLWPKGASDALKQQILSSAPPSANILGTDRLQKLNSTYGFTNYGSGYFDLVKLADTLLQPSTEGDRALFEVLGYSPPEMSAECRTDVKQLVANMPQVVFGATRFDANGMDSLTVLEVERSLAAEMVPIAAQIPDAAKGAKWFGFGLGINSQALIKFLEGRAKAVAAAPYKCEELADLDKEMSRAVQQLRSAGGFMGMAKGMSVRLDAFEMDMANKTPSKMDATLVIASDAPQALIGMASMGMPQLAQLGLANDGVPKALPMDDMPPQVSSLGAAWAVMTESALAVRFAPDDQGAGVKAMVNAPLTAPGTLLTYSFTGELYRMLAQLMRSGIDPSTPVAQQEQMAKLFEGYADIIGRFDNNILLTPRGVEIQQIMSMK